MKKQIKDLRIKIDGLAQLTKELSPKQKYIVDIAQIPKSLGWSLEQWLDVFNRSNYGIVDSNEKEQLNGIDFNTFITPIPFTAQEINKAVDSLYLAKAWLGKVLGELGTENPYGSGYKTKEDIVPTQDVNNTITKIINSTDENEYTMFWKNMSHIEKVDWLRTEISKLMPIEIDLAKVENTDRIIELMNFVYQHLCEARFWLGFEMEKN